MKRAGIQDPIVDPLVDPLMNPIVDPLTGLAQEEVKVANPEPFKPLIPGQSQDACLSCW